MDRTARQPLPIDDLAGAIAEALASRRRLILEAPTGSGKSTRVPGFLLDSGASGDGSVVVMQPRRMAARMLARRTAWERGCALGGEVGYQVRFENHTGPGTRIRYETDGVILRRLLDRPSLDDVSTIVFDEFHERHLYGDVMLAKALEMQRGCRPDLNVVVMSATLATGALADYLAPCEVLRTAGRTFPVEVAYLADGRRADRIPVWDLAAEETAGLLSGHARGDVLVFMPGAYEIRRTIESIRRRVGADRCVLMPLHGELPPEQQDAVMEPSERRKIIVATNVAETSLTIPGVQIVVDSGLARKARFDPHRGINTLWIEKISRASADQRAGRAGRTGPGFCLRLWTPDDHAARLPHEIPEIRRLELSETILLLKDGGVSDLLAMRWLDPPDEVSVRRSLALLGDLGAMDNRTGAITPMGKRLLAFPVHPRIARMLLAGHDLGCAEEAALAAALAQEGGLHLPRQNRDIAVLRERRLPGPERERSDFGPLLRSWRYASERNFDPAACRELGISDSVARRVARLYEQFRRIAADEGLGRGADTGDTDALAKCILTGFADQVGVRIGGDARRYALVHGRRATLDRDSAVAGAAMVVAAEIHEIGQSDGLMEVRLGLATAVEQEWLASLFPGALSEVRHVRYDASEKRVVTVRELRFRDLVIESRRGPDPHPSEAAKLLAGEVLAGNLTLKHWDHAVEQWILRVNLVAEWYPESGVAPIDEAARQTIVEQVCLGGVGYRDIKDRPVWPAVRAWLSGALHAEVERMAPERLNLPNGRSPKVTYAKGGPPAISLRVQELYGVNRPLTVAGGRVRVVVHVLAPNFRPVQVTDDLASFWQNAYPAIRKEYQRKYPKHEWRERGDR